MCKQVGGRYIHETFNIHIYVTSRLNYCSRTLSVWRDLTSFLFSLIWLVIVFGNWTALFVVHIRIKKWQSLSSLVFLPAKWETRPGRGWSRPTRTKKTFSPPFASFRSYWIDAEQFTWLLEIYPISAAIVVVTRSNPKNTFWTQKLKVQLFLFFSSIAGFIH